MRALTHWRWHLDEVYVKISGEMHYLWRAVDHQGEVLGSFASKTRDEAEALKCRTKLMKLHDKAKAITTDGLSCHRTAMKELGDAEKKVVENHTFLSGDGKWPC
jgi:putative transposase